MPAQHACADNSADAGFTLVEVMISVALFGLIAIAGITLMDAELGVQARTDGRLERLGDLQRAMYVMTADLEQLSQLELAENGALTFSRFASAPAGGEVEVRYGLRGAVMERIVGGVGVQDLVTGVSSVRFSYFVDGDGWRDEWVEADAPQRRPRAVAVELTLAAAEGEGGTLRRLVQLPAAP